MTSTVIGLTGGIGSGKSTVSDYLQSKQIPIIDTDIIARNVVAKGSEGLHKIVEKFGSECLLADGSLDRAYMRNLIFQNPELKRNLENILHPLIQKQTLNQLTSLQDAQYPLIVVVIPLLIESLSKGKAGNKTPYDYLDQIWVVDSPEEQQIKRAKQRDANNEQQIRNIMAAQASREERLKLADRIIVNNDDLHHLYIQVDKLLNSL